MNTKEDYQKFAKIQLHVYGRATFGWAYWAFKHANNHWNLEWMIKNGYIKLQKEVDQEKISLRKFVIKPK